MFPDVHSQELPWKSIHINFLPFLKDFSFTYILTHNVIHFLGFSTGPENPTIPPFYSFFLFLIL